MLGNLDPALEHAWHPVALAGEVRPGGYASVRLLGRTWTVHRDGGGLSAAPPAWGVRERLGLIWLAPAEPRDEPLEVPEDTDPRYAAAWLPPARTGAPAGVLADAFLDGRHSPSRHDGSPDRDEVPAPVVEPAPGGFTGVRDRWAAEPGTAAGRRLRRRDTLVHRAPFQLLQRVEERDTGSVRVVLFLLQPEDADSTRVYARVLLRGAGTGTGLPPGALAAAVAAQEALLAEDRALLAKLDSAGLPLLMRAELHLPADRLGVELRRTLADFAAAAGAGLRETA